MDSLPAGFEVESTPQGPPQQAQPEAQGSNMPEGFEVESHPGDSLPAGFEVSKPSDKYQGAGETAKAAAEGAASSILPFGAAEWAEKRYLGAKDEDILGRAEAHPIAHAVGQIGGLLTPISAEGKLMGMAGEGAAKVLGLAKPATYAAKIGSSIVKNAAEMAVMQGSDETAKMVLNDPNTTVESALGHMGLSAAIGGGAGGFLTGAVSPLWKLGQGKLLGEGLASIVKDLGSSSGVPAKSVEQLSQEAGIPVSDTLAAKVNGNEYIRGHIDETAVNDSFTGKKAAKQLVEDNKNISNKISEVVTNDPNYLKRVPQQDLHSTGQAVNDSLLSTIGREIEENTKVRDATSQVLDKSPITSQNTAKLVDDAAQIILTQNLGAKSTDTEINIIKKAVDKLGSLRTVRDLKTFTSSLGDTEAEQALKQTFEGAIDRAYLESGASPELLQQQQAMRQQYGEMMSKYDRLAASLSIPKKTYGQNAEKFFDILHNKLTAHPENAVKSLSGKASADVLQSLAEISPDTLSQVRQHHVNELMRDSMRGKFFSPAEFATSLEKLSPQVRDLVAGPAQQTQLKTLTDLAEHTEIHGDMANEAGSKIVSKIESPLFWLATMAGHGWEALAYKLARMGASESKDAVKMAFYKFMSSGKPVDAGGFKAMTQLINATYKGQNALAYGTKALFDKGAKVMTTRTIPTQMDRDKLEKQLDKQDAPTPDQTMNMHGPVGHYMEEHQVAMTAATQKQIQYLKALKPQPVQLDVMSKPIPPSPQKVARYNRAMNIALNPYITLEHIKNGTLLPSDVQDMNTMYPALTADMSKQIAGHMSTGFADGNETVPYKTRLGLSLFLGSGIDNTMSPQSIQAAQPMPKQPQQAPQGAKSKGEGQKHSTSSLNKVAGSFKTPSQTAESDRSDRS